MGKMLLMLYAFVMAQNPLPPTGIELVTRTEAAYKAGVKNEEQTLKITITDASGKGKEKELRYLVAYGTKDGDRRLLRFQEPPDDAGTGLLNLEHRDRPDDQWLFLKSLKKVRRIASSGRSERFVGTDYSVGDTRSENITMWTYGECIAEEVVIEGERFPCWRFTATPKDGAETDYTKRILWIHHDLPILVKEEMHDRRGLWKTRTRWKISSITIDGDGTVPRATFEEMTDRRAHSTTQLSVLSRKFNQTFSSDPFTVRELEKGR